MQKYIALDFDGTCVFHRYPEIGEELPNCVRVLRILQEKGYLLILNTMRCGTQLEEAVAWFRDRGIFLSGINVNPQQSEWTTSPKVYAQYYIDDAAVGAPTYPDEILRPAIDWNRIAKIFGIELK